MNESIAKNKDNKDTHPNSMKAIEPYQFKKGQSGNAGGRPKKYAKLAQNLIKIGSKTANVIDDKTYKEEVLERIWFLASTGEEKMIFLLAEIGALD